MENPELRKTIDSQINEIFSKSFPGEIRYKTCDHLIDRVKKNFTIATGRRFNGPDTSSHMQLGFVVGSDSANKRYEVTYFRYYSVNSEEKLSIIKNHKEKVNLKTLKYSDGRYDASFEYFDDGPNFKRPISDTFEVNSEMGTIIVDELAKLLEMLK